MSELIKVKWSAPTLYDLMWDLGDETPEIKHKWQTIYAKIKTFVHTEKHHVWFMFDLHFLRDWRSSWFEPSRFTKWTERFMFKLGYVKMSRVDKFIHHIEDYVEAKDQTHGTEGWGDLDKNLEWVTKYGAPPVRPPL